MLSMPKQGLLQKGDAASREARAEMLEIEGTSLWPTAESILRE